MDYFNPLDFAGGNALAARAIPAARRARRLKARARAAGWLTVIANDHFGRWQSNFGEVAQYCVDRGGAPKQLATLLWPDGDDIVVLKPRHSAFHGTPLHFLLQERAIGTLLIAGLATDSCVLFTALDAYLRQYRLWIPSDCSAAERSLWHRSALAQMRRSAKAWTGSSRTELPVGVEKAQG